MTKVQYCPASIYKQTESDIKCFCENQSILKFILPNSQKLERREHKQRIEGSHQTTKRKTKKEKNKKRNIESIRKQGLKWL